MMTAGCVGASKKSLIDGVLHSDRTVGSLPVRVVRLRSPICSNDVVVSSHMDSLQVRPATRVDVELVSQLNQHVQQIHVAAEPSDFRPIVPKQAESFFRDLLSSLSNVILIADQADKTLGYVWAQDLQRAASPLTQPVRSLYIHHIAVDPEGRRMGVGRALILGVEEEAAKRQIESVALDHWSFNQDAQEFFGSMGYGVFNVRMRKDLGTA
jgi:ribosomal protein S18 acetylase RimI-like enzyme